MGSFALFNQHSSHQAEVKYIEPAVLAQVACLPVCKLCGLVSEQILLHKHKVSNCDTAVCVDIAFYFFFLLENKLLSAAVPVFPLTDVCAVVSAYLVYVKAAQTV